MDSRFNLLQSPFWSGDGKEILFIGHRAGEEGHDLYEVDSAGGEARLLMHDNLAKLWPILSPDGSKIAYLAAEVGRQFSRAHVWMMNSDGTEARDLTPFSGNWESLSWSPDGQTLIFDGGVYDAEQINYQIVTADISTGQVRILTSGDYGNRDPHYFADGERIAYISGRIRTTYGGKVWIMDADGSNPRPVDTTETASAYPRPHPVENRLFFFWGLALEGDAGTYSIPLDSVALPTSPEQYHFEYKYNYAGMGQWSPNGELLIFPMGNPHRDLYLMKRDGTTTAPITSGLDVVLFSYAWSRDSRSLVFRAVDSSYEQSFYSYDVTGGVLKKLTVLPPKSRP